MLVKDLQPSNIRNIALVSHHGAGKTSIAEALLFLIILGAGFVYCWLKGDLDWVKSTRSRDFPAERLASARPFSRLPAKQAGARKEAAEPEPALR